MRWTDIYPIAEALAEQHPDADVQYIRYTDLHAWVCALPGFADEPDKSNEKILEAIQMAWLDEVS